MISLQTLFNLYDFMTSVINWVWALTKWAWLNRTELRTRRRAWSIAIWSTSNPTLSGLGSNLDLHVKRFSFNHLTHGSHIRGVSLGATLSPCSEKWTPYTGQCDSNQFIKAWQLCLQTSALITIRLTHGHFLRVISHLSWQSSVVYPSVF